MNKGLAVLCVIFVGLAAATMFFRFGPDERPPSDDEPQRYLYCPECGLEMTCPPDYANRATFCPHCGVKRQMEVNSYSHKYGGGPGSQPNRALLAFAFGVPVALAVAVYAAGRLRASREKAPEPEAQRFACPGCGHKMATGVFGPGSTAVCPVCAEQFVVPGAGARSKPAGDTAKVQEWGESLRSELTKKGQDSRRTRPS